MDLVLVHVRPEEGDQGIVSKHVEARYTAAAEKVTAHRSEDRNESEEAVIDAEEATSKACDPTKVFYAHLRILQYIQRFWIINTSGILSYLLCFIFVIYSSYFYQKPRYINSNPPNTEYKSTWSACLHCGVPNRERKVIDQSGEQIQNTECGWSEETCL